MAGNNRNENKKKNAVKPEMRLEPYVFTLETFVPCIFTVALPRQTWNLVFKDAYALIMQSSEGAGCVTTVQTAEKRTGKSPCTLAQIGIVHPTPSVFSEADGYSCHSRRIPSSATLPQLGGAHCQNRRYTQTGTLSAVFVRARNRHRS